MNNTFLMNVKDLTTTYAHVYDGNAPMDNWKALAQHFLEDEDHNRTVQSLINHLKGKGTFREPVSISNEDLVVNDGTHRVIAAMLAGVDSILVRNMDDYEYDEIDDSNLLFPEINIRMTRFVSDQEFDEITDAIVNKLISVEINNSTWLNMDFSTAHNDTHEMTVIWTPVDKSNNLNTHEIDSIVTDLLKDIHNIKWDVRVLNSTDILNDLEEKM